MKIEITNIEELLYFLNEKYNYISDEEYNSIVLRTLSVYGSGKPETKEQAITQISTHWDNIKEMNIKDRPFFFWDEMNDIDII